jgi:hypothetical protein
MRLIIWFSWLNRDKFQSSTFKVFNQTKTKQVSLF